MATVVHQDDMKQCRKLFPLEKMNVECNKEAKNIIRQTIKSHQNPLLPFTFSSPVMLPTENIVLVSVNDMRKEMR